MMKKAIVADGCSIAYREAGAGKTVVLLHGFCGSSAYWDEVIPLLEGSCRLIVPDLRGHGQSDAPAGTYSIEAYAEDVSELLGQLAGGPAIVLGHSLGGYITLAVAELHPEQLSASGLIHSTAYPDDEKGKQGRLNSIKTIEERHLPVFIDGLVPKLFAPSHLESMPDAVEKAKRIGCETSPTGAMNTLEGMRVRPDRNRVLRETKLPVLLLAGEKDQIISRERAFSVSGDHITEVLIPEAGHMSMMETPEKLAEAIKKFVQSV